MALDIRAQLPVSSGQFERRVAQRISVDAFFREAARVKTGSRHRELVAENRKPGNWKLGTGNGQDAGGGKLEAENLTTL
jgi:hypothetical protein